MGSPTILGTSPGPVGRVSKPIQPSSADCPPILKNPGAGTRFRPLKPVEEFLIARRVQHDSLRAPVQGEHDRHPAFLQPVDGLPHLALKFGY